MGAHVKVPDIAVNDTFGRWEVIGKPFHASLEGRKKYWLCVCVCCCNAKTLRVLPCYKLLGGRSTSCGCKYTIQTHGLSRSLTYTSWMDMRRRCYDKSNPSFKSYGGRGIRVCKRWESFEAFLDDMGKRPSADHSIERDNVDLDYAPGNCKWATAIEQANNRRNNVKLTYKGQTATVSEWSRLTGIKDPTIRNRIKRGWTIEQTLSLAPDQGRKRYAGGMLTVPAPVEALSKSSSCLR